MRKVLTIDELRNEPGFVKISEDELSKRLTRTTDIIKHYTKDIELFANCGSAEHDRIYDNFAEIMILCESGLEALHHFVPEDCEAKQ